METLKNAADILLKLAVVAALATFLHYYVKTVDIGRYAYISNGDLEFVMDTKTGVIYQGGFSMNHITGEENTKK